MEGSTSYYNWYSNCLKCRYYPVKRYVTRDLVKFHVNFSWWLFKLKGNASISGYIIFQTTFLLKKGGDIRDFFSPKNRRRHLYKQPSGLENSMAVTQMTLHYVLCLTISSHTLLKVKIF